MNTTPPPLTPRRWLAGLVEITASLIQQLGFILDHVGDGAQAIADHLDPVPTPSCDTPETASGPKPRWARVVDGDHIHTVPLDGSIAHDQSDDCPCGPAMRCQQTGRGDVWLIKHHRLDITDPATEGA